MLNLWVRWQAAKHCLARRLKDERGATDMVVVIILVAVVVAVAIIFREQLMEMVKNVIGKANKELVGPE